MKKKTSVSIVQNTGNKYNQELKEDDRGREKREKRNKEGKGREKTLPLHSKKKEKLKVIK